MNTNYSANRLLRTVLSSMIAISVVTTATQAFAHQWEIKGEKVEAELKDYNTTHVFLMSKSGAEKVVPMAQLTADDLDYVTKLVAIRESKMQERFQSQSLRQKQAELMLQATDTWYVTLQDRRGQQRSVTVFADDSRQAANRASRQYPYASVAGVRRQRQRGRGLF